MRYFANRSQLARLDFHTRLIMTYFLVFMLAATGLSMYMSHQRTRLKAEGAAQYYRGHEERLLFPKEPAELIETSHFHLFMMPLIFLTVGHLFLLSAWPGRWKTLVITSCFAYVALDLAKPWLVRYAGAAWGALAPINAALLGSTLLLCIGVVLYEMWFLKERRKGG